MSKGHQKKGPNHQDVRRAVEIGKRMRARRLELGLSQRMLAEPGVSYAYISRIEAGKRNPSVKALRKVAAKLGVTPEYLETGNDWTTADHLLDEAMERIGGGDLTVEVQATHYVVRWRRLYGGGVESDERMLLANPDSDKRPSLAEVCELVIGYEDEADRIEAAEAQLEAEREAHQARAVPVGQ